MSAYNTLGRPVPTTIEQRSQCEFENGSRIISLPGADAGKVRAYSATLLIVDEASRVEDKLLFAARPMLATTGGEMILLSTPAGKRGGFHAEWEACEAAENRGEQPAWQRFHVTAPEIPSISAEFLEEERLMLPRDVWLQEYFGLFVSGDQQFFSDQEIESLFTDEIEEWQA